MFLYECLQTLAFHLLRLLGLFVRGEKFRAFVDMRAPRLLDLGLEDAAARLRAECARAGAELPCFWVHVASAGELEQAVPVARTLAERHGVRFFLTYFSPSAAPFIGNFPGLVGALGLPVDTVANHRRVILALGVKHLFFVRYDLWPAMIEAARRERVPVSVLAATASATRAGPRGWASALLKRRRFAKVSHLFAVGAQDVAYFSDLSLPARVHLAGDSKWSRARERAEALKKRGFNPDLRKFYEFCTILKVNLNKKCLVFGSPHMEEATVARQCLEMKDRCFVVFVPPEIDPPSLAQAAEAVREAGHEPHFLSALLETLEQEYAADEGKRSPGSDSPSIPMQLLKAKVSSPWPPDLLTSVCFVIVDRMGFLAELYAFADIAVVGGGFDGQIHNTLEPAAHPVATLFGNKISRAPEAQALVRAGAARPFGTPQEMFQFLHHCVKIHDVSAEGLTPAQQLAELRLKAMELFWQIPNTSEVVSSALFARPSR